MGIGKFSGGSSVIELIAAQSEHLVRSADALAAVASADRASRIELNVKLHDVEHAADDASHKVLQKINQSFVLPFDRDDLYNLTQVMDDCVDLIDEAGDNMVLFKVGVLPDEALELIEIIKQQAQLTRDAMQKINVINDATRDYWLAINGLENRGDAVYRNLVSQIFDSGRETIDIFKMKLVIDALEAAIDRFEALAAIVETIAIKES